MAEAPGHLLGQFIGNVLEAGIKPYLQDLAYKHDLFLDTHGARPGVRDGLKLGWVDDLGNTHDLDFVLERGGSKASQGQPAAFIEAAWRRYTKHSKAKAQEIQGAVLPLLAKWNNVKPAAAAVVAGEWTKPALLQMERSGFTVLHLHFPTTVSAFQKFGINIAGLGEGTTDAFWHAQVETYRGMSPSQRADLAQTLREDHADGFAKFALELEKRIVRAIDYVVVTPLHGTARRARTIQDAVDLVMRYPQVSAAPQPFVRFEVRIVYTNGDKIDASFAGAGDAANFLQTFA